MAKKSAYSKGFRKVHKEVKGYTPQEKKIMIIGGILLVVIFLGIVFLPDFIESFSLLKVEDGVVQGVEDNWLVVNTGTSGKAKYKKLAEVEAAEGYELDAVEPGLTDSNLPYFRFKPVAEGAPMQTFTVQQGSGEAKELCEKFSTNIGYYGEILNMGEVQEHDVNGMKAYSVISEYRMQDYSQQIEAAQNETAEETTEAAEEEIVYEYTQNVIVYLESAIGGKCVVISGMNTGADESVFGDSEAMLADLLKAAACVTIEK